MTRKEHIQWCKNRAVEYLDMGDIEQAWASITSDLGKHTETVNHLAIEMGTFMRMNGYLSTIAEMREFILDIN